MTGKQYNKIMIFSIAQCRYCFFIFSLLLFFLTEIQTAASSRTLTVLQTTDIHCHLSGSHANWLRAATIINRERRQAGAGNLLLIDCGDTIAGTFSAAVTRGAPAVTLLNLLHYDIWVPGNHDYDFGIKTLLQYRQRFRGMMLAGNLQLQHSEKPFVAWKMFRRAGMKIAVIGLSLPGSEKHYWPQPQFTVKPGIACLQPIMHKITAARPDIIILAAHCGMFTADKLLLQAARCYPEIDLILGGHTHEDVPGVKIGPHSWFVQAGKYAEGVAKISLTKTNSGIVNIESYIIPVTPQLPCAPACITAIGKQLATVNKLRRQIISTTNKAIIRQSLAGTGNINPAQIVGRAAARAAGVKLAYIGANYDAVILPGAITRGTAFNIYPFMDTVCTMMLSAAEMKQIINEQLQLADKYHQLYPYGFRFTRHGKKVSTLYFADGRCWDNTLPPQQVAFSSYDLSEHYCRRYPRLQQITRRAKSHPYNTGRKIYRAIVIYLHTLTASEAPGK